MDKVSVGESETITEYDLHCAVANYLDQRNPPVRYTSMAQGVHLGGMRGKFLKAKGTKKHIPDIIILHSRGTIHYTYNGCLIELKKPGSLPKRTPNKYTKIPVKNYMQCEITSQIEMAAFLNIEGYYCVFLDDFDKCISVIEWYLNLPKPKRNMSKRPIFDNSQIKHYDYNKYKRNKRQENTKEKDAKRKKIK